jgi:hypothetical protein
MSRAYEEGRTGSAARARQVRQRQAAPGHKLLESHAALTLATAIRNANSALCRRMYGGRPVPQCTTIGIPRWRLTAPARLTIRQHSRQHLNLIKHSRPSLRSGSSFTHPVVRSSERRRPGLVVGPSRPGVSASGVHDPMFTSAECHMLAEQILVQVKREPRRRARLLTAAEDADHKGFERRHGVTHAELVRRQWQALGVVPGPWMFEGMAPRRAELMPSFLGVSRAIALPQFLAGPLYPRCVAVGSF